ncbi:hypothetical protein OPT61_g7689 [Boeremia exigua]|uniref:Uncharacterized protein n=1 Tax=Boeremia exigua TaxID=749465 RepID=A0ACC2I1B6_9PLEO|nr:hypothetical protein OPT61_g7689 [Boeremia exigua]
MAIHPDFSGLTAEIVVNGEALQEYAADDEEQDTKDVTNYVQASSGAYFAIRYVIPQALFTEHSMRALIKIDGVKTRGQVWNQEFCDEDGITEICNTSAARVNGVDMSQKLHFAELSLVEASEKIGKAVQKQMAHLGHISVSFYAIENLRRLERLRDEISALQNFYTVPEKALKGRSVTHSVQLGPLEPRSGVKWWDFDFVDPQELPFAVFNFKYRSLDALKTLGKIPRTPSPPPLEDRPVEDLTPTELAELVTRYRANAARIQQVKQERAVGVKRERDSACDSVGEDEVSIVEERPRKRRNLPGEGDEVITLD